MRRLLLACAFLLLAEPAAATFARVGSLGTGTSTTAGTSLTVTTSATLEAGNVGVCAIGKDETGTGTTDGDLGQVTNVTDGSSNRWVKAIEFCNAQTSTAADGACIDIWWTKATTQLTSGGTITITLSASTTSKAATCDEFTMDTNLSPYMAAGQNGLANDAADPGSMTAATTVSRPHLFVRASACESNTTTYTADTDYTGGGNATAGTGTAATSMGARIETRVATEATSAASDPTYATADCASAMAALNEDPGCFLQLLGVGCR
jgi:hypothetical protein